MVINNNTNTYFYIERSPMHSVQYWHIFKTLTRPSYAISSLHVNLFKQMHPLNLFVVIFDLPFYKNMFFIWFIWQLLYMWYQFCIKIVENVLFLWQHKPCKALPISTHNGAPHFLIYRTNWSKCSFIKLLKIWYRIYIWKQDVCSVITTIVRIISKKFALLCAIQILISSQTGRSVISLHSGWIWGQNCHSNMSVLLCTQ